MPPVSRLQKVHNAKVALDRLVRGAGLTRLQRLTPDDVVDGHREKTISIIWEVGINQATPTTLPSRMPRC